MLEAKITIDSINYEQTLGSLFQLIMQKLEGVETKSFAVRLLLRMGEEARTAALGILKHLDQTEKNEIICGIVNRYASDISGKINQQLSEKALGEAIRFQELTAVCTEDAMILHAAHIEADYQKILSNPAVQGKINETAGKKVSWLGGCAQRLAEHHAGKLARAAAYAAPEHVERVTLHYLQQEEHKASIRTAVEKAISGKGIALSLQDMEIVSSETDIGVLENSAPEQDLFSNRWEDSLLEAIVAYLKEDTAGKE